VFHAGVCADIAGEIRANFRRVTVGVGYRNIIHGGAGGTQHRGMVFRIIDQKAERHGEFGGADAAAPGDFFIFVREASSSSMKCCFMRPFSCWAAFISI